MLVAFFILGTKLECSIFEERKCIYTFRYKMFVYMYLLVSRLIGNN